jgi:hypothetical protein
MLMLVNKFFEKDKLSLFSREKG